MLYLQKETLIDIKPVCSLCMILHIYRSYVIVPHNVATRRLGSGFRSWVSLSSLNNHLKPFQLIH